MNEMDKWEATNKAGKGAVVMAALTVVASVAKIVTQISDSSKRAELHAEAADLRSQKGIFGWMDSEKKARLTDIDKQLNK